MNTSGKMLYPMLAVGAFMVMFWTGVVVGYELGLSCLSLLAAGLASACLGAVLVSELERRDAGDYRPRVARPAPSAKEAEPASPGAREGLAPVTPAVPAR